MAPFAFLGSSWDAQLADAFSASEQAVCGIITG
jgi:hypothetical protein